MDSHSEKTELRAMSKRLSAHADDDVTDHVQHVPSFTREKRICTRFVCSKYWLFVINFLVWIAGGALVGVGTWSRLQTTSLAAFDHVTIDVAYLLIGIGAIMFVVSLFGCTGALRNNVCLLKVFIVAVVLLFVAQLVAGVLAFVLLDTVESKLMDLLRESITNFNSGDRQDTDEAINHLQKTYSCCGGASYQDWDVNVHYNCSSTISPSKCGVPTSCCLETTSPQCGWNVRSYTETFAEQQIYTRGCIGALMSIFKDNLVLIGIIAFVVGVLQLCSLLLANCLMRYITTDSKHSL